MQSPFKLLPYIYKVVENTLVIKQQLTEKDFFTICDLIGVIPDHFKEWSTMFVWSNIPVPADVLDFLCEEKIIHYYSQTYRYTKQPEVTDGTI